MYGGKGEKPMSADLKNWEITVEGVTAEDMKDLAKKAGAYGLSIGSLLGNFINDLVDGQATNGSDERMYARQWFDRCWFGMFPEETFLYYLGVKGYLEEVLEAWRGIQTAEVLIADTEKAIETGVMQTRDGQPYTWKEIVTRDPETDTEAQAYSSREEWEASEREYIEQEQDEIAAYKEVLARCWEEYTEQGKGDYTPGTFDEEMKKVLEWAEKNQRFLR